VCLPLEVVEVTLMASDSYADRDAQRHWASAVASNGNLLGFGVGGIGGQLVGSMVKGSIGRVFR
jgi:hypothetical protein